MGKPTTTSAEAGRPPLVGAFAGSGQSAAFELLGHFNVTVWGTFTATVVVQRSFDGGATWIAVSKNQDGADASYTAPFALVFFEPEPGVLYRLSCTHTSGTANYRLSQ